MFTRGRERDNDGVDDFNISVDQMSEIDNILQGINSGHIVSSPTDVVADPNTSTSRLSADREHCKIRITIMILLI